MAVEDAVAIVGLAFLMGVLVGFCFANTNAQMDITFLATNRGIGCKVSSRPSIQHYARR